MLGSMIQTEQLPLRVMMLTSINMQIFPQKIPQYGFAII